MNNIKIFRANRGEGKTKWLMDKVDEACSLGLEPIYLGSNIKFNRFRDGWMATRGTVCPVKHIDQYECVSFDKSCFFTDELIESIFDVFLWKREIIEQNCPWFITMSKEDFVN